MIFSSENSFNGSIFSLSVPSIKNGSCGIIYKFFRRCFNPISLIFNPSIKIYPSLLISNILLRAFNRVDFPDPVLPTTPIFSLSLILKETCFNTTGVSSLYFISKFSA